MSVPSLRLAQTLTIEEKRARFEEKRRRAREERESARAAQSTLTSIKDELASTRAALRQLGDGGDDDDQSTATTALPAPAAPSAPAMPPQLTPEHQQMLMALMEENPGLSPEEVPGGVVYFLDGRRASVISPRNRRTYGHPQIHS